MKRFIGIVLLMVLSGVAIGQTVNGDSPLNDNDFVYDRYAVRSDLTVAQLVGYPIDSNRVVNVIMLQANNDSAWSALQEEFIAFNWPTDRTKVKHKNKRCVVTDFSFMNHDNPTQKAPITSDGEVDILGSCLMVVAYDQYSIWLFYYNTEAEALRIVECLMEQQFRL